MRLALDTNELYARGMGARTYLEELLPELLQLAKEPDVVVLLHANETLPAALAWLTRHGTFRPEKIPMIGRSARLWRRAGRPAVERLVSDIGPLDVTHSISPPMLPSRARTRIVSVQGVATDVSIPSSWQRSLERADAVIVPAQRTADRLSSELPDLTERLVIIPPGVAERYRQPPKPSEVEELCRQYPFLESPYLLAVGTASEPTRAAPHVVAACKIAWAEDDSVPPLVMVAASGEAARVADAIRANGEPPERVYLLEGLEREALPALYRGAEMMLQPCLGSGFGHAVLEAGACGIPSITDTSCGALDLLGTSALTPRDQESEWARAIVDLHRDEATRQRLGEVAQRLASERTWSQSAQRHWELYGS